MRVCICCSGGITSKMLVRKLQAARPDPSFAFFSMSESFLDEALDEMDVLLVAPHVMLADRQRSLLVDAGVVVADIPQDAYARADVGAILGLLNASVRRVETAPDADFSEDGPALVARLRSAAGVFKRPVISVVASAMSAVGVPMIVGSLLMTVLSLPFPAFQHWLDASGAAGVLRIPVEVSADFVALYAAFALGYCYARAFDMDAFWTSVLSAAAFLCSMGADLADDTAVLVLGGLGNLNDGVSKLGPFGLFPAMVCALATCSLLRRALKMRKPGFGCDRRLVGRARSALAVLVVWTLAMALCRLLLDATPYDLLNRVVQLPFSLVSANAGGFVAFLVLGGLLWLVGLHGNMLAYAAIAPVYSMMYYANIAAFTAGHSAPYAVWFLIPFVYIGGTGCTLALNLLFLTLAKSRRARSVGAVCIASSLCNVGEPMMFGAPVMYSRDFSIPFLVCPLVNLAVCCLFMFGLGLVPPPTGAAISMYYPLGISAALTCGSLRAWVLWVALLALDIVIYAPFAYRFDARQRAIEQEGFAAEGPGVFSHASVVPASGEVVCAAPAVPRTPDRLSASGFPEDPNTCREDEQIPRY